MAYLEIWKKYKVNITAMAAFVAWLWFFPLFGIVQAAIADGNGKMFFFNLIFLGSTVMGYVTFLYIKKRKSALRFLIAAAAPITAAATWLAALMFWQLQPEIFYSWGYYSFAMFVFLPVLMGFCGAIYFAFWGTTIYYVLPEERGRYMAAMVLTATIFYAVLVLIFYTSPLVALLLSALLLLFPSYTTKTPASFIPEFQSEDSETKGFIPVFSASKKDIKENNLNPWKAFWFPFALIIFCFYILAWETHSIVFSVIKEESIFLPIVGQSIYALAFIFAGYYLDKQHEIEKLAIYGFVVLGCSFLLLPVALPAGTMWPIYSLLEASYGFIDLFMWVSLAYFCQLLRGNPLEFYSRGLLLNILFIMFGVILMPLITFSFEGEGYFILSLAAGIILFIGILPALSLRKLRLADHASMDLSDIFEQEMGKLIIHKDFLIDDFTKKEKEIFFLMLTDHKNPEIAEKLGISKNTLKTHIRNIYRKALVKNRSELLFKFAELKRKPDD